MENRNGVKLKEEHTKYSKARIENCEVSRKEILKENDIHISKDCAKKYDTMLCKEDIIKYKGKMYALIKRDLVK